MIKEPPNILVNDNVSDVGPANVEEGKECETAEVRTERLQMDVSMNETAIELDILLDA